MAFTYPVSAPESWVTLSEIGRAGHSVDLVGGGEVADDGRVLSVAEIQRRFRERSAARESVARTPRASVSPGEVDDPGARGPLSLPQGWVRVLAGHSGAGASTVALAVADAAAAAGRPSQVIEAASPARSGLVSAARHELDVEESGAWKRGVRPNLSSGVAVTIVRRADDRPPSGWPSVNAGDGLLVVVDLGLVTTSAVPDVEGGPVVVVCRMTIPGVRLTEQLLARLPGSDALIAVLGGRRWPGEVSASLGPRLRALRQAGRVITVPVDQRLTLTGPTHLRLPKTVLDSGEALLGLIEEKGTPR